MLVQDMGLQVLDVLLGKAFPVQGLDFVLHDVAVLLDVVLLVQFVAQRHDILVGDVGVGVELGAGGGIGSFDIVPDKIPLLAEVHSPVEGFDILQGGLLVDGHEGFHHLTADFLAGHLVVNEQIVHYRDDDIFRNGLSGMDKGQPDPVTQLFAVKLLIRAIGLSYFHSICA